MKFVVGGFLLLLALFGMPLFAVIGGSAMWNFHQEGIDLSVLGIEIYRIAEMPILLAIPLFTFAGYVLSESGAPGRLVRFTAAFIGWMPGGLAIVALAACAFFTAFTGASGVTIIALGALLFPALNQAGYPEKFNLGLITTSGSLGILFAPSLPLILYGIVAQQMSEGQSVSIDDLFIAGILPGLLMVVMLSAYALWVNRANRMPLEKFEWARAKAALRESAWEIPLPFVVLGGIYGGYLAVSEAAAITAIYVTIVEVFILREISWRRLPNVIRQSMVLVGGVLIILGVSLASTNYLIDAGVPQKLFELIRGAVESPLGFLLLLNVFLLVLGAILDIFSALVLVVPLILPIAAQYGIHPVHLGIIFLANMQLGYSTPPVGLNLFIASYRFDRPITEIYMATLPYLAILMLSVLIITYVPALSLGLL
ncbi:MAG: TRAP transporter large permease subunit [Proteobacteria bacterium]|nr:TRAP transporter large permease subunit [Pseudomonadota bacterium]